MVIGLGVILRVRAAGDVKWYPAKVATQIEVVECAGHMRLTCRVVKRCARTTPDQ